MAGGVVSLSDPSLKPDVMRRQIENIGARAVFCSPDNIAEVRQATESVTGATAIVVNPRESDDNTLTLEQFINGLDIDQEAISRHKQRKVCKNRSSMQHYLCVIHVSANGPQSGSVVLWNDRRAQRNPTQTHQPDQKFGPHPDEGNL